MSTKKKLTEIKLTFIEESEVPVKPIRFTPYRDILRKIKKGKALVVSDNEINIDTFRAGVLRLQKKGEFTKYCMRGPQGIDGKRTLYVVNPTETKPTEQEEKATQG
jgi:hypothetical protein